MSSMAQNQAACGWIRNYTSSLHLESAAFPDMLTYPDLEVEDIREALHYAVEAVRERELPVLSGS